MALDLNKDLQWQQTLPTRQSTSPLFWQVELEGFHANADVCAMCVSTVVFLSRLLSAYRPTRAKLNVPCSMPSPQRNSRLIILNYLR